MGLYPTLGSNPSLSAKSKRLVRQAPAASNRPHPISICGKNYLQNLPHRLQWLPGKMDRLSQLLFPHNPKRVRHRKMQSLYFAVFISLAACAAVGVGIFLLNNVRGH